jgi:hypothetical protein
MDYKRQYDELIERAVNRPVPTGYTENHHIIPKCMGGSDSPDNLVALTAREHFLAHRLLARMYPNHRGLTTAILLMSHKAVVSSRTYARLKEAHAQAIKDNPIPNGWSGKTHSEATKAKMSEAAKGKRNHQSGKPLTAEHKAKIGEAVSAHRQANPRKTPHVHTAAERAKISKTLKGRKRTFTAEHKENIRKARLRHLALKRQEAKQRNCARQHSHSPPRKHCNHKHL